MKGSDVRMMIWLATVVVVALLPSESWSKRHQCMNRPCSHAPVQPFRPAAALPPPSPASVPTPTFGIRHPWPSSRHSVLLRPFSSIPRSRSIALDSSTIRVIDGDTFAYGHERIRIRGVNAPELSNPQGIAAKRRLADVLRQGSIRVDRKATDVYGRVVADVYVNGEAVTALLNRDQRGAPR